MRLHGFLVYAFASAEEFLESPYVGDTNCVITDIRMPGMSGVDLQAHLIAQSIRVPVIFISAFPEESSRKRALEAGAVGFLTKPFDGKALIDCLSDALRESE